MVFEILTLISLIEDSKTTDDKTSDEVLYRFVSATCSPYEIAGVEEDAIALLINFSVKRSDVTDPLSMEEALCHLADNECRLIKRHQASLKGWHTHNIKFPNSYFRGNIRCVLPFDEHDPYVHSGSVRLRKRFGYAQNAENIKACKGLLAEFYYQGQLTSMLEEIQQGSALANQRFTDQRNEGWFTIYGLSMLDSTVPLIPVQSTLFFEQQHALGN